jgi:predicted Zn-dependent protease
MTGAIRALAAIAAIALASSAIAQDAEEAAARAEELLSEGRIAAALLTVTSARTAFPDSAELAGLEGRIYFEAGAYARAVEPLEQALDRTPAASPRKSRLAYMLAISQLDLHRESEAVRILEARLAEDPDDSLARYGLGWYHLNRNEFEAARRELARSAELGLEMAGADLAYARKREEENRELRVAHRVADRILLVGLAVAVAAIAVVVIRVRRAGPVADSPGSGA